MRLRTRPNGAAARSISAVIGAIPPFIPARAGRASFRTGIELVRYAEAADAAHVSAALLERDEAAVVAAAVAVVLGAPAVWTGMAGCRSQDGERRETGQDNLKDAHGLISSKSGLCNQIRLLPSVSCACKQRQITFQMEQRCCPIPSNFI